MSDTAECIIVVCLIIVGTISGMFIGCVGGIQNMRDEAVKHGKAEYYLDEKHERQWRWKP